MNKMGVTWVHLTQPRHILQSMISQPNLNKAGTMNFTSTVYLRPLVYDFPDNFYIAKQE